MSAGFGWLGIGVGLIGGLVMFFMSSVSAGAFRAEETVFERSRGRFAAAVSAVLTLIIWAIAMQSRAPYSPGQALGFGFLIGGITGIASIMLILQLLPLASDAASVRSRRLAALSCAFLGLCGVSLTYLIYRGDPQDALLGFSIGVIMTAILHYYLQDSENSFTQSLIEIGAIFPIAIASAVLFAVNHFDEAALRTWWALPLLISATVLIASYIGAEIGSLGKLREKPGMSYLISAIISSALILGLAAIYAWKIIGSWELLEVTAIGIAVAAVIAWLAASVSSVGRGPNALEAACASVILIGAFAVFTFKLWAGLGMAIGLIAASSIAFPAFAFIRSRSSSQVTGINAGALLRAFELGLAILLFRVFVQQYRADLNTADIRIHYTFIGAFAGLVMPFALGASLLRLRGLFHSNAFAVAGVIIAGLFAALSPVLIYLLWDQKAVMGLSFGLTAAVAFLLLIQIPASADSEGKALPLMEGHSLTPLAIGAQLAAVQFIRPLGALEITRAVQLFILAAAVVLWLAWYIFTSILSARRAS